LFSDVKGLYTTKPSHPRKDGGEGDDEYALLLPPEPFHPDVEKLRAVACSGG